MANFVGNIGFVVEWWKKDFRVITELGMRGLNQGQDKLNREARSKGIFIVKSRCSLLTSPIQKDENRMPCQNSIQNNQLWSSEAYQGPSVIKMTSSLYPVFYRQYRGRRIKFYGQTSHQRRQSVKRVALTLHLQPRSVHHVPARAATASKSISISRIAFSFLVHPDAGLLIGDFFLLEKFWFGFE